jgi:hypothetical protein
VLDLGRSGALSTRFGDAASGLIHGSEAAARVAPLKLPGDLLTILAATRRDGYHQ